MAYERTEDEILSHAPIKAKLGDKEYEVKLLTIGRQREWRTKMAETTNELIKGLEGTVTGSDAFMGGLRSAFLNAPEKIADLVFAYAPDLDRKEIEETATEEQLLALFSKIMVVAFPFARQLGTMVGALKTAGMSLPSVPSMSSRS